MEWECRGWDGESSKWDKKCIRSDCNGWELSLVCEKCIVVGGSRSVIGGSGKVVDGSES